MVKIPHGLWGLVLYYWGHKNSLLVHILNQTNTAHTLTYFISILILSSNLWLGFQKASSLQCFQLKFLHNYKDPRSSTCGISAYPQHFEIEKECIQWGLLSQFRSHFKILVARRVASNKFHTQYPQILGAIWLTWHPGFEHPCCLQSFKCLCHTWRQHWKLFSRSYCNLPHCFKYFIVIQAEYRWVFQPWHFPFWQKFTEITSVGRWIFVTQ